MTVLRQRARKTDRRPRGTEGLNILVAVQNFGAAIADGARVVTKYRTKGRNVVRYQSVFVAFELGFDFGDDLRQVNLHSSLPISPGAARADVFDFECVLYANRYCDRGQ